MKYYSFLLIVLLTGCYKGKTADLVIYNAHIHTLADNGIDGDAIAISDGKILEVGPERQIRNKYRAEEEIDAGGRDMYPGLTDAHAHLLRRSKQLLYCDLTDSKSMDEVLVRLEKHQSKGHHTMLVGYGWDESNWLTKTLPTNELLNARFPNIPVCLYHANNQTLLVNQAMYDAVKYQPKSLSFSKGINRDTPIQVGIVDANEIHHFEKIIPKPTKTNLFNAFLRVQQELHQYGIIGVHEAGIESDEIDLIKHFMDHPKTQLEIYAMLKPSDANITFAKKNGIYTYKNLTIRSFNLTIDGSINSCQALLKEPYLGKHEQGQLLTEPNEIAALSKLCASLGYQLNANVHGDSACRILLDQGQWLFDQLPDHRWRIEHAQLIDKKDLTLFSQFGFFPSVQPGQLTTVQNGLSNTLGSERMNQAFIYKSLLQQYGMLAIGSNFPENKMDPFINLHAAVNRKNEENIPTEGFNLHESISLTDFFAGMTKWAAFASFSEQVTGTLEIGKRATFVLFDQPVTTSTLFTPNFAWRTYLNGKCVYSADLL